MGKSYLVLEYVGSQNLFDFVKERYSQREETPISMTLLKSIMRQLFGVLDYLHQNKICHRDLKPDNILIRSDILGSDIDEDKVTVKVIDFNVAVDLRNGDCMIKGGTGLKEWSAPETRQSLYSDVKIDCWTLGCIMFMLCTGNKLFNQNDEITMRSSSHLKKELQKYSEDPEFFDMVDFLN